MTDLQLNSLCQYLETLYEYHLAKSENDISDYFSCGAAFAYLDILKQLYADFD